MGCFKKNYSEIYDLLYSRKNYFKEFNLIKKIINKNFKKCESLLDLGCGTGEYSNLMTSLKLNVVGVDRSLNMIKIAKRKYSKNYRLKFIKSNIENINLKKKFDIISALFHILSYQNSNPKIDKFFLKSYSHLKKNGILIFDFWYKNGVFSLQSPMRVRQIENDDYSIVRTTLSQWHKKIDQIYDQHNLIVLDKKKNFFIKFKETHKMKYFDIDYIKQKLKKFNFKFIQSLDLETGKSLTKNSWGALVVAKKL